LEFSICENFENSKIRMTIEDSPNPQQVYCRKCKKQISKNDKIIVHSHPLKWQDINEQLFTGELVIWQDKINRLATVCKNYIKFFYTTRKERRRERNVQINFYEVSDLLSV